MDFLKRLFGGGAAAPARAALLLCARPVMKWYASALTATTTSLNDDNKPTGCIKCHGHQVPSAPKLTYFNQSRQLKNTEISGGVLVRRKTTTPD